MQTAQIELTVLASALLLTTLNIFVYAWVIERERFLRTGIWILRVTSALTGFVAVSWGIYLLAHDPDSTLAKILNSAGLLLIAGGFFSR